MTCTTLLVVWMQHAAASEQVAGVLLSQGCAALRCAFPRRCRRCDADFESCGVVSGTVIGCCSPTATKPSTGTELPNSRDLEAACCRDREVAELPCLPLLTLCDNTDPHILTDGQSGRATLRTSLIRIQFPSHLDPRQRYIATRQNSAAYHHRVANRSAHGMLRTVGRSLRSAWGAYEHSLHTHPIRTQAITSGFLWYADAAC